MSLIRARCRRQGGEAAVVSGIDERLVTVKLARILTDGPKE